MSEITPEMKKQIYEEEKARAEAQKKIKSEQATKGCLGCLGVIVIIVMIGGAIHLFTPEPTPEEKARADVIAKQQKDAADLKRCESTLDAFYISKDFVERTLKAPATAKFPSPRDAGVGVNYLGNCTHLVSGYVDSQNGFGALIRSRYSVKVQNERGTEKWKLLDIKVQ